MLRTTRPRAPRLHAPPHVVGACLALLLLPASGAALQAGWREAFAAGEQARRAGQNAEYAQQMIRAVSLMDAGLLNRPFTQYHAARAFALAGRPGEAIRYLEMAWDEGIEGLMISFAAHDPAFDDIRATVGLSGALERLLARAETMELRTAPLGGGVHLVHGAGSEVVVSVGPDGVLLVDTGYGPALPALRRAVASLGGEGIDVVVLTHPHEDHWGAAEALGDEAVVLAHPGTAEAMTREYTFMEGVVLPPKATSAHPDRTVRDTVFTFNGEEVHVLPVEAHTGADLAVHFRRSRVVHFGDAYLAGNPMMFPGGEDPDGFLDRLDAFLDTLPEGTVVVGGHDPPTDAAAVRAQVESTRGCMALVRRALEEGLSLDEAIARAEGRYTAPWVRYFFGALGG